MRELNNYVLDECAWDIIFSVFLLLNFFNYASVSCCETRLLIN